MIEKESLVVSLYDLGAVRFGEFKLKSGEMSPIYLDLRLLVSRPSTLRRVARMMQAYATRLEFNRLAAVPLAGLPIGVALGLAMDRPLVYPRIGAKEHGTGRIVEGIYEPNETVLLVDDVVSYADSKLEAIELLEKARLKANDLLVVVDRQMGGAEALSAKGYMTHSLLTLQDILDILQRLKHVSEEQNRAIMDWLDKARGKRSGAS